MLFNTGCGVTDRFERSLSSAQTAARAACFHPLYCDEPAALWCDRGKPPRLDMLQLDRMRKVI